MRRYEIAYYLKNDAGGVHDPADLLATYGPNLQVVISVPNALAESIKMSGGTPAQPITVPAVIDTGCTRTAVDEGMIAKLGIPQNGVGKTVTANGEANVTLHSIYVFFPQLNAGHLVAQAQACKMPGAYSQVLLGTDILRHFVMIYDGVAGRALLLN